MSLGDFIAIKTGLQDFFRPYSATVLPTSTNIERISHHKFVGGVWRITADYQVVISAKRLARDNVDLELGNAEREVERIIIQYKPNDIPNIHDMQYGGRERIYDSQDWSRSNWSSRTFIRIKFNHVNNLPMP